MEKTNDINTHDRSDYDITDVIRFQKDDVGRLVLRVAIGGLMLFHGLHKVFYGTEQIGEALSSVGMPALFSWGVFLGEVIAPIMLILGYKVRVAGFLIAFDMLVAILLVHAAELNNISPSGGWMIELNALYFLGAVAIMFLGSGSIAITKGKGALD
ncbi:DoxX family protein [Peredibacter sp. HCB2-198]|uniref:DoxX family protein n=1 Tax=Peredibacter sp. HCB2-198 TaxID=3383025 RepID=UPI0038B45E91